MKKTLCILLSMITFNSFVFGMGRGDLSRQTDLVLAQNRKDVFCGIRACDKNKFDLGWPTYARYLTGMFLAQQVQPEVRHVVSTTSSRSRGGDESSRLLAPGHLGTMSHDGEHRDERVVKELIPGKTQQQLAEEELGALLVLTQNKVSRAPNYTAGCYQFRQSLKGAGNGLGFLFGLDVVSGGLSHLYEGFLRSDGFEKLVGAGLFSAGAGLAGWFGWRTFNNAARVYYAEKIVDRRRNDIPDIQDTVTRFGREIADLARREGRGDEG